MRMTLSKEFYVPVAGKFGVVGEPAKVEFVGGEAYLYERQLGGGRGTACAMAVFLGKQSKPVSDYHYGSAQDRQKALDSQIASSKASAEYKAKRKEESKPSAEGVAVGDIFVSSGGYDQTNVEALQVVELKGKTMVKVRVIGCESVPEKGGTHDSQHVMPVKDSFLDKDGTDQYYTGKGGLRKVVGGRIKGTWGSAGKWDGKSSYYNSWGH